MKKVSTFKVVSWIFIIAFLLISVFPFFWILVTSFKPETEIFGDGAYRIIAQHPTLDAFKTVIFEKNILRAVWNSFVMSGFTTLYVIVVASMSAYIISRFKFKGKNLLMALILTVAMFPQMIIIGPVFNMYYSLGKLNSYWVCLAYSSITLPSAVWIMVAHLWRIIFPIAAPGVFTTAIMTFISAWNEYLLSCTMNSNESIQTVPVRIGYLRGQYTIYWNQIAAAAVVVVIPTLVMVLLFQKQIVAGIANGAVKE